MLLAVDTSTQTIGIALYENPCVIGELLWQSKNHHTVELTSTVKELMNRCGVEPDALSLLICALGPGTFTGLRIGLAFIKGLALSLHIPVIGIPTFDILAAAMEPSEFPLLCVLPAGRSRLAVSWYKCNEKVWQQDRGPFVKTPEELSDEISGPTLITGEMTPAERQIIGRKWKNAMITSPADSTRRPALLAELGWQRWQEGQRNDPISLAPIYLHVADPIPE